MIACRHKVYYCEELSTYWALQPSVWNKGPQKGDCAAGRSLCRLSAQAKAFVIQWMPVRHPAPSEDGKNSSASAEGKIISIVNYFQHKSKSSSGSSISGRSLDLALSTAYLCTFSCQPHAAEAFMMSTWRPWAFSKTKGGDGFVFFRFKQYLMANVNS